MLAVNENRRATAGKHGVVPIGLSQPTSNRNGALRRRFVSRFQSAQCGRPAGGSSASTVEGIGELIVSSSKFHSIGSGSRTNILWGYLFGGGLMLLAAVVTLWLGVRAERRPLEEVARPLSSA